MIASTQSVCVNRQLRPLASNQNTDFQMWMDTISALYRGDSKVLHCRFIDGIHIDTNHTLYKNIKGVAVTKINTIHVTHACINTGNPCYQETVANQGIRIHERYHKGRQTCLGFHWQERVKGVQNWIDNSTSDTILFHHSSLIHFQIYQRSGRFEPIRCLFCKLARFPASLTAPTQYRHLLVSRIWGKVTTWPHR